MNDRLYRSRDDRILAGVAAGLADHLSVDVTFVRLIWLLLVPLTGGLALVAYIVMAVIVPEEVGVPAAPWTGWSSGWPPTSNAAPGMAPPAAPLAPGAPQLSPQGPPPPPVPPMGFGMTGPPPLTRAELRAQRRAYRAASRAERGPGAGGVIIGSIFVLIGVWLLLRQYVPEFDPDRFWPFGLVALGVVLLVFAVARRPEPGTGAPGPDVQGGPGRPGGPDASGN